MIVFAIIMGNGSTCNHLVRPYNGQEQGERIEVVESEQPTFGYAKVEAALCNVFNARGEATHALRGRLKSFQRAGLTPANPGRGKVICYTISHVYDWAFALALADFGLPPEAIVAYVKKGYFNNNYVKSIAALKNDSWFCCLLPYVFNKSKNVDFPFVMMKGKDISAEKILSLGGRAAFIDLTGLKRKVDAALD